MFVVVITGLVFFGCVVSASTKEYEAFQLLKDEVNVIRDLNFFLEMPIDQDDQENNVLDLIIESYLSDDYNELNEIAVDHFSKDNDDWKLVLQIGNTRFYNSVTYNGGVDSVRLYRILSQTETKIPILEEDTELMVIYLLRERRR
ncbi:MAG: hypothetical protein IIC69_02520 [Nanoarchaeota archaeon]|nr:hypothetical protein [Nanoarchaeota archaeon]